QADPAESLAVWKVAADTRGFVVAVPVPHQPHPTEGYSDIVTVAMVRAGVQAAAVDPRRTAVVGHLSAGAGAVRTVFDYPGLTAAVAVVGSAPPLLRAKHDLGKALPPLLFLTSDGRAAGAVRKFAQNNPGLSVALRPLAAARARFAAPASAAVLDWVGRRVKLGAGPPYRPPAPALDPAASAELTRRAAALKSRGAEAGAYICLLRAARLAPEDGSPRLSLARLCLNGRRLYEATEWADAAARLPGDRAAAQLVAAEALARTGSWRLALERAALAGSRGKAFAARLDAARPALEKSDGRAAMESYRRAVRALREGDYPRAAQESRRAVELGPWEVVYRAFAVHAVCAAEGPAPARKLLDDYLRLFPEDPYASPMAAALDKTLKTDYSRAGLAPSASLLPGEIPAADPAAAAIGAMSRRAGREQKQAELVSKLSASGASRELRMALPVLRQRGIPFQVGSGSVDDLRAKLAGDVLVLVQLPPGQLAGLRSGEKFAGGMPALVLGYDDRLRSLLVLVTGEAKRRAIPYGLFDRLWASTDRWWLVIPPLTGEVPGREGALGDLELGTALLSSGGLRAARPLLAAEVKEHPHRAKLGLALLTLAEGNPAAARKRLAELADAGPEYAIQVKHALGTIEDRFGTGPPQERLAKALPHYRAAWELEPGNERSTLVLAAALMSGGDAGRAREARAILDDYLRFHPSSLAALRLYYSR
ncbi:MAG: hypothetical protein ACYTGB_14195, partial [Planctomycetota bacterium]